MSNVYQFKAPYTAGMTLEEARALLGVRAQKNGDDCPCCLAKVKVYDRPLTSVGSRAIAALFCEHGLCFGHMAEVARKHLPDVAHQGGYLVLGQHWGLIEPEPRVRGDRGRTGFWRVTAKGEQWLAGEVAVPKYARLFHGTCLELHGDLVTREDALGQHFDFTGLMATRVTPSSGPAALFDLRDAA